MNFHSPHVVPTSLNQTARLQDFPAGVVDAFLEQTLTPRRLQEARDTLKLVASSPHALALVAIDPAQPLVPIAVGVATKSMHDYGHWGMQLVALAPGCAEAPAPKALLRELLGHIDGKMRELIVDLRQDPSGKPVPLFDSSTTAISVGTMHPELFREHGFATVHSHTDSDGRPVEWLFRVSGKEVRYFKRTFSTQLVEPVLHAGVAPLVTPEQVAAARAIVAEEWGEASACSFDDEYKIISAMPGSAFYGITVDGVVKGVGAVIKSAHHPEAWSRAWIVVDKSERGTGLGLKLVQGLNFHAQEMHAAFSDGAMVMEGITYIPEYYVKFGNQPIAQCVEAGARGFCTWTMRLLPSDAPKS